MSCAKGRLVEMATYVNAGIQVVQFAVLRVELCDDEKWQVDGDPSGRGSGGGGGSGEGLVSISRWMWALIYEYVCFGPLSSYD